MTIFYSADFLILVLGIIWLLLVQNFLFKEYASVSMYVCVTDEEKQILCVTSEHVILNSGELDIQAMAFPDTLLICSS